MRRRLHHPFALLLAVSAAPAQSPPAFPPRAEATEARLITKVGPQTRALIKQEAGKQTFDVATATRAIQGSARANLAAGDVDILSYLLLMEATRSAKEDLKSIMDSVKSIDAAKARLRQSPSKHNSAPASARRPLQSSTIHPFPVPKAELDNQIDKAKSNLDSMSELGERESLRLQMAMDRTSKMMSTLSNLLKKISDTGSSLTQNLK
jgi:hypothetical protein